MAEIDGEFETMNHSQRQVLWLERLARYIFKSFRKCSIDHQRCDNIRQKWMFSISTVFKHWRQWGGMFGNEGFSQKCARCQLIVSPLTTSSVCFTESSSATPHSPTFATNFDEKKLSPTLMSLWMMPAPLQAITVSTTWEKSNLAKHTKKAQEKNGKIGKDQPVWRSL